MWTSARRGATAAHIFVLTMKEATRVDVQLGTGLSLPYSVRVSHIFVFTMNEATRVDVQLGTGLSPPYSVLVSHIFVLRKLHV